MHAHLLAKDVEQHGRLVDYVDIGAVDAEPDQRLS
jgi:hypothetical protein